MKHQAALARIIHFFESLSKETVDEFAELYSSNAFFKDPFNEVQGQHAIATIFRHMFRKVDVPEFVVTRSVLQDDDAFIVWNFNFRMKGAGKPQCIHGSSHLHVTQDGKVDFHRDYWDTAEELYEKIKKFKEKFNELSQ